MVINHLANAHLHYAQPWCIERGYDAMPPDCELYHLERSGMGWDFVVAQESKDRVRGKLRTSSRVQLTGLLKVQGKTPLSQLCQFFFQPHLNSINIETFFFNKNQDRLMLELHENWSLIPSNRHHGLGKLAGYPAFCIASR